MAVYHSAVNFASLGYGDIVMSEQWKMLGALEAVVGVLMLGMTSAALMAILSQLIKVQLEAGRSGIAARRDPSHRAQARATGGSAKNSNFSQCFTNAVATCPRNHERTRSLPSGLRSWRCSILRPKRPVPAAMS